MLANKEKIIKIANGNPTSSIDGFLDVIISS
jgi:hypothetical protein